MLPCLHAHPSQSLALGLLNHRFAFVPAQSTRCMRHAHMQSETFSPCVLQQLHASRAVGGSPRRTAVAKGKAHTWCDNSATAGFSFLDCLLSVLASRVLNSIVGAARSTRSTAALPADCAPALLRFLPRNGGSDMRGHRSCSAQLSLAQAAPHAGDKGMEVSCAQLS